MQAFAWGILSHTESGMFHPTAPTVARLFHSSYAASSFGTSET